MLDATTRRVAFDTPPQLFRIKYSAEMFGIFGWCIEVFVPRSDAGGMLRPEERHSMLKPHVRTIAVWKDRQKADAMSPGTESVHQWKFSIIKSTGN